MVDENSMFPKQVSLCFMLSVIISVMFVSMFWSQNQIPEPLRLVFGWKL